MIDNCGIKSVENIIYNGIDLSDRYTDHDKGTYLIVNSVYGRGLPAVEIHPSTAPFFDGSRIHWSRIIERIISVKITMKGGSIPDLREKITDLAMVLTSDRDVEIQFSDEPHLVYYGRFNGFTNEFEVSSKTQIEFEIICGDPYKYSKKEKEFEINDDVIVVENEGNESTAPIIELTAHKPTTYAMIENGVDEYNLVGFPLEEDGQEEIVDDRVSIFREDGSTLNEWSTTLYEVDKNFIDVSGTMTSDGAGIRAESYGKGNKMHGPAVTKELPKALQDFEITADLDIISRRDIENWRAEVYFLDENLKMLGKMGVKDNSRTFKRRFGLGRVGHYRGTGKSNGYAIGSHNYSRNTNVDATIMHLKVKREGDLYTFYIGRWRTGRYQWVVEETYKDKAGTFNGRLKYITLFLGNYQDRPVPFRMRFNKVEVFELKQLTVDQTPYILRPGDVVTFDHVKEDILINGENAMRLKNFGVGNSFWQLLKGYNSVTISPPDTFTGKIKYREKYK